MANLAVIRSKLPWRVSLPIAILLAICIVGLIVALTWPAHGKMKASSSSSGSANVAGWNRPWRPGKPNASHYGEAFQVLNDAHPPARASAVYWLGGIYGNLYPYVRAMMGHGAEVMLSTVIYGNRNSADYAHLQLTSWNTQPLNQFQLDQSDPTNTHKWHREESFGGELAQVFRHGQKEQTGKYSWIDVASAGKGWWTKENVVPTDSGTMALVRVAPHTILQVIRLDQQAPPLRTIILNLHPYPQS